MERYGHAKICLSCQTALGWPMPLQHALHTVPTVDQTLVLSSTMFPLVPSPHISSTKMSICGDVDLDKIEAEGSPVLQGSEAAEGSSSPPP